MEVHTLRVKNKKKKIEKKKRKKEKRKREKELIEKDWENVANGRPIDWEAE